MNSKQHRYEIADAAAIILSDATHAVDGSERAETHLSVLISTMIAQRASESDWVHLAHSLGAVATMAVTAELRESVERGSDAGPAVSMLARLRMPDAA